MKKLLRPRYLPYYTLIAGLLGFLLRLWTLGGGPNKLGLYEPQPIAWILMALLCAITAAVILYSIRGLKNPGKFIDHFPASLPGAVGCGFCAVGLVIAGFTASEEVGIVFSLVMTALAITGALGMCLCAVARKCGNRPPFWPYLASCVYLGLRLFDRCRGWSEEPQTAVYLFPFLASTALMLAMFHMTTFHVNTGKRRIALFFSLSGIFLSLICLASSTESIFYGCMALFLLTNLYSLRPLNKTPRAEVPEIYSQQPQIAPTEEAKPNPADMSYDELMDWLKNGN